MYRSVTKLLLVIYGFSIISNSVFDAGHEVLHYFKNSIHHHDHDKSHHVREHHILLEKDLHPGDSDSELNLTILSCLVFCEDFSVYDLPFFVHIRHQPHTIIARAHCGYATPPLAPPLS
jgi:hypothetical protein